MTSHAAGFDRSATITCPSAPSFAAWLRRALRQLAQWRAPAPPTQGDRWREAADVREWALKYRHSDPGFAADLFAAADRHELGPH